MAMYHLYEQDIPSALLTALQKEPSLAVDTEAMGLRPQRDRLCLVQFSTRKGPAHLVRIHQGQQQAPNLKTLLSDPRCLKLFHYARFDMAALENFLDIHVQPVFCTKIASRLVRTFTDRHGLAELIRDYAGISPDKTMQSSDWGAPSLSDKQCQYAARDVLYLHTIHDALNAALEREGRTELAQRCFDFLPTRVRLDLQGWPDQDIFAHS